MSRRTAGERYGLFMSLEGVGSSDCSLDKVKSEESVKILYTFGIVALG